MFADPAVRQPRRSLGVAVEHSEDVVKLAHG
jgi:hypothetical protein